MGIKCSLHIMIFFWVKKGLLRPFGTVPFLHPTADRSATKGPSIFPIDFTEDTGFPTTLANLFVAVFGVQSITPQNTVK